jgi:2-polyprenyl-3-methyl-5-hydroxy-6-metoxy-1,4-benzoquinol methylase
VIAACGLADDTKEQRIPMPQQLLTPRLQTEQLFHDQQARQRARDLTADRLRFTDADYLDHESWIRPAMSLLGNVAGKQVLDMGCGHGMASVVLARRGAHVTAFDLSLEYVREAHARAAANGVTIDCLQADAEHLPFPDNAFDAIWGNAILHHLDLQTAAREIHRVLRPGGNAVFCEPWGGNPFLNWIRRRVPYPGKERTPNEAPLTRSQVEELRAIFPQVQIEGYQLLSMIRRGVAIRSLIEMLEAVDRRLFSLWPGGQQWCRYVVLRFGRR